MEGMGVEEVGVRMVTAVVVGAGGGADDIYSATTVLILALRIYAWLEGSRAMVFASSMAK